MIFKKKYIRSEWFEGLLEAEEFIRDGYDVDKTLSKGCSHIWFTKESESFGIPLKLGERSLGVFDYLDHLENKLK